MDFWVYGDEFLTLDLSGVAQVAAFLSSNNVSMDSDDVAACGVCNVLPTCSPDNSCICFVTTSDCCFCVAPRSCAAAEPCRKNSDCPPGFKCVHSCCDAAGFGPLCGMPCGSPGAPAAADLRGQMTQAGQL